MRQILVDRVGEKPDYDLTPYKAAPNTIHIQKPM